MTSQILMTIFSFAGSGIALWIAARLRSDARKSRTWATAEGVIVERAIETMQTDARAFTPKVKYVYTVAGEQYTGQQLYQTGSLGSTRQSAKRLLDSLPVSVPVRYNPENPSEAFLLADPDWVFWLTATFGVGAFVLGLVQVLTLDAK